MRGTLKRGDELVIRQRGDLRERWLVEVRVVPVTGLTVLKVELGDQRELLGRPAHLQLRPPLTTVGRRPWCGVEVILHETYSRTGVLFASRPRNHGIACSARILEASDLGPDPTRRLR